MYSTVPDSEWAVAGVAVKSFPVMDARQNYLADPSAANKEAYIQTLKDLYDYHMNSVKGSWTNNPYTAPVYLADGILDSREAAHLTAIYQKQNTRGSGGAQTMDDRYNDLVSRLDRMTPRTAGTAQMVGGTWRQESAKELASNVFDTMHKAVIGQRYGSARPAEDKAKAKILTNKFLGDLVLKPNALFASIRNEDTGDVIRAFMNPRSSASNLKIKASPAELKMASAALAKVRENSNVEAPLLLSLLAASSSVPGRENYRSGHSSNTLGYAFPGGGAHLYVDRVNTSGSERERNLRPSNDGWWSTEVATTQDVYMHTGVHEIGHVVMYKTWGKDTASAKGEMALASDYKKFGITDSNSISSIGSRQPISEYGKESVAEHFAEAYARYVITGDATPEFRALLESKNLLKSQKKS